VKTYFRIVALHFGLKIVDSRIDLMDLSCLLVRASKISPDFLESNATSHTWPFSAVAELIDNAYDPDVKATELRIDVEEIGDKQCLVFTDDGAGMDNDSIYKMLSFGYSNKPDDDYQPIGRYGNGFKSGTMRLGKDALVFTRHTSTSSVGFLSRTYLKGINSDSVLIPILTFRNTDRKLMNADSLETKGNLSAISKWTMFKSEIELKRFLFGT